MLVGNTMRIALAFLFGAAAWAQTASVEGVVRDSATRAGVPGARVTLWTRDAVRYEASTDAGGAFHIAGMKEGEYRSRFEKEGYAESEDASPHPQLLSVATGPRGMHLDGEMIPLSAIRGRVLDSLGRPIAEVQVEIMPSGEGTTTAQDGAFVFERLTPGSYRIAARPEPAATRASPGESVRIEPVATYYPSTTDSRAAQAVVVRGAVVAGIDITLRAEEVHRIRGAVVDESGKRVAGAIVRLIAVSNAGGPGMGTMIFGALRVYTAGARTSSAEAQATSGDDGAFEFASVRLGQWNLAANKDAGRDLATHRDIALLGGASVNVGRRDLDDVEIRVGAPFELTGSIDWGGQPAPSAEQGPRPSLMLTSDDGEPGRIGVARPDGSLHVEGVVPGRYHFFAMPWAVGGFVPAAVMLGDRDVSGQAVELVRGSPPVRLIYKATAGGIRGTVEKGAGSTLLLRPTSSAFGDFWMSMDIGPGGTFEMDGLMPGDYSVAAFDRVDPQGLGDTGVEAAIAGVGTRVRVGEGSLESVELRVNRWPR